MRLRGSVITLFASGFIVHVQVVLDLGTDTS